MGELFFGRWAVTPQTTNEACMKVSHTTPNSGNPIRLSRNELDVSNHLIRIITLTRGIVLMNPLPWVSAHYFLDGGEGTSLKSLSAGTGGGTRTHRI